MPAGVYLPRGVPAQVLPPVNRMTDRCKNITLLQTSFAGGNNNITWDNKASLSTTKTHFPLIASNDTGQESFTLNPNNLAVLKFTYILVEIYLCNKEYYPQPDKIDFTVNISKQ